MRSIKIDRDKRVTLLQWLQQGYIDYDKMRTWDGDVIGEKPKLPPLTAESIVWIAEMYNIGLDEIAAAFAEEERIERDYEEYKKEMQNGRLTSELRKALIGTDYDED